MRDRINRPRVFLSHSAKDKDFIEKLAEDLRRCQVEPWLDTEEIRDGKPWLRVIFEDGIPTCNAVIVYFTENSLRSKMVSKEIDAALVEELGESGISFLPYVSSPNLRAKLRSDIRSLQCREWNDENYNAVLPSVVAEIWRDYLEKQLSIATLQEKNKRLELELELKKVKKQYEESPFSPAEEKEFQYVYRKLNKPVLMSASVFGVKAGKVSSEPRTMSFSVQLISSIVWYVNQGFDSFQEGTWFGKIVKEAMKRVDLPESETLRTLSRYAPESQVLLELQTYGLVNRLRDEDGDDYFQFSNKMYRLRYWLDFNNLMGEGLEIELKELK